MNNMKNQTKTDPIRIAACLFIGIVVYQVLRLLSILP
jgi:hypothetical protein